FAAKIIGKIDDIKFSENRLIKSGEQWLQIGSGNRIAKMRLPMAIEIVEANEIVKSQPGLVTKDPHNLGWLLKIKPPKEIGEFRKGDNAKDWLEKEFDRLHQEFEQSIGLTIADGGEIASDLYERLSDEQWHGLVKKFLE
ncbi:MAG: hypothetical protein ABIL70_04500, partial [candidate division WOR-3 bacterium]